MLYRVLTLSHGSTYIHTYIHRVSAQVNFYAERSLLKVVVLVLEIVLMFKGEVFQAELF